MGISRAEYARHRGCSRKAVTVAVQTGRIHLLADGTIDPERADAEWAANTRHRAGSTPTHQTATTAPGTESDYNTARTRRELANAELAELKLAEERAGLVRRAAVQRMLFGAARQVRDRLLSIPARVGPLLAGESDILACRRIVADEIQEALEDLVPPELREE